MLSACRANTFSAFRSGRLMPENIRSGEKSCNRDTPARRMGDARDRLSQSIVRRECSWPGSLSPLSVHHVVANPNPSIIALPAESLSQLLSDRVQQLGRPLPEIGLLGELIHLLIRARGLPAGHSANDAAQLLDLFVPRFGIHRVRNVEL